MAHENLPSLLFETLYMYLTNVLSGFPPNTRCITDRWNEPPTSWHSEGTKGGAKIGGVFCRLGGEDDDMAESESESSAHKSAELMSSSFSSASTA